MPKSKKRTTKKKAKRRVSRQRNAASSPTPDKKFEIESDLRTMQRADEIRNDPQRMGEVRNLANKQVASLRNISRAGRIRRARGS